VWVFSQQCLEILDELVTHLLVGQTELPALVLALAVDFTIPLGVVGEVLGWGEQRIEGVDESGDGVLAPDLGSESRVGSIGLVAERPFAVKSRFPERLAVFHGRYVAFVEFGECEVGLTGDGAGTGCPPTAADLVFEEGVDGVQGASGFAAGEDEVLADRADDEPLVAEVADGGSWVG